jgi:shikimate 5-dehydrogenase
MPDGLMTKSLSRLFAGEPPHCDIMINTLPFGVDPGFDRVAFPEKMFAYDISYAKESRFLECAGRADCRVLDGTGMFEAQALLQRRYWGLAEGKNVEDGSGSP